MLFVACPTQDGVLRVLIGRLIRFCANLIGCKKCRTAKSAKECTQKTQKNSERNLLVTLIFTDVFRVNPLPRPPKQWRRRGSISANRREMHSKLHLLLIIRSLRAFAQRNKLRIKFLPIFLMSKPALRRFCFCERVVFDLEYDHVSMSRYVSQQS